MAPAAEVRPPLKMVCDSRRIIGGEKISDGILYQALLSVGELSQSFDEFIGIGYRPPQTLGLLGQSAKKLNWILPVGDCLVPACFDVFDTSHDALFELSIEHQEDIRQDLVLGPSLA
jgi:hypothetical protein